MKIVKRVLLGIVLLLGIAVAAIYFYKDKLIKRAITDFNRDYNITIDYNSIDLSLFKKFPDVNLTINNLNVINDDMKDTLFASNKIYFALNIKDLFKDREEKIAINDIVIEKAKVNLIIAENGMATFDVKPIFKKEPTPNAEIEVDGTEGKAIKIDINNYEIVHSDIIFKDVKGGVLVDIKDLNHSGFGNFKSSLVDLNTKTTMEEFTFSFGDVAYFNKVKIDLEAVLGMDLDNQKFTFKENKLILNNLALVFDGFVDMNETNQEYDITFKAPKANFKSVLSLIPNAYSKDFSGVSANGVANVSGFFKGTLSDTDFPKYNMHIKTTNASFKYPDLPKTITNINFDGIIASNTANNDVYFNLKNLELTIDKDTFKTSAVITKLTTNPTVNATFKGTLDLGNLTKAYPIKMEEELSGVLKANFSTQTDQKSVESNNFDKIKTNGTASLEGFSYSDEDIANPIHIDKAAIKFKTNSILLTDFKAKTGKSDIQASGKLDNLYAFIFDDKGLRGDFNVASTNFIVSDFLVEDTTSQSVSESETVTKEEVTTSSEVLKIPDFLDITTKVKMKRVVYDNITLTNVSGLMKLKDQKATLKNTKATMLGGNVVFNGDVNTKPEKSTFDLDMNINKFDIANSFNTLETFQKIVPVAKALDGRYNTTFNLKGNLDNEFSPEMNSLSGDAFAQLLVNNIDKTSLPLINTLASSLKFIDFSKVDLSKIKAALSFEKGRVTVKPFDIKYNDIKMTVAGSHGFDESLSYAIKMNVPAKYLGKEALNLLSKLTNINKDTIKIPLSTIINGSMLKPTVKVDFKSAFNNLKLKVIEYQKQELTTKATNEINNVVSDALENIGLGGTSKDSTTSPQNDIIKEGVNSVLNGLFGKKKKKK